MPVKVKKMIATFGGLEKATLTPGDGLTIITAPNESGKSTWAAFLKAMLYGVDTKDRDKIGYLADKNRYQPWSGAPMSGELQLEWQGRDITIRRTSNRSGPMQQFEAVYTATGDPVPGLTGANVGQTLLGVGKDVFMRSALVGQNATSITAAPELESRIAALATSGEEDVSATATQRTLKDWRNRRRSNRSNGIIPELENELRTVEQMLRDMELARNRRGEAQAQIEHLSAEKAELEFEQGLHRKLAVKELNKRCGEALERLQKAQAELESLPPCEPIYEGLGPAEAREKASAFHAQAEEARILREQNHARDGLRHRRGVTKALFKLVVALFGGGGLAAVIVGFIIKTYAISYIGFGMMFFAVAAAIVFVLLLGSIDQKLYRLTQAEPPAEEVSIPDPEVYVQWLICREGLEREVRHYRERYDDLTAQGGQPLNTLELLPQPRYSAAETSSRIVTVERELARWQTQLDQAIGALRADPLVLEARRGELEARLERRTAEYDALDLALAVLDSANASLRERFSPTLNREAAVIFDRFTGGKYSSLTLSRDFSAVAGGDEVHSALYLSAGTVDQLYLAVRLALCRLTVPDSPVLLDDALCTFDDNRMVLALEVLKELGKERQILLFSCHSREAQWAEQNGVALALSVDESRGFLG